MANLLFLEESLERVCKTQGDEARHSEVSLPH